MDVRPFTKKDAALLKHKSGDDGWWEPDQFAWVLKRVHRIVPAPYKGQLRLFNPPAEVARLVRHGSSR